MIIKSTENLVPGPLGAEQTQAAGGEAPVSGGAEPIVLNSEAISILCSIFHNSGKVNPYSIQPLAYPPIGPDRPEARTAGVKFMITGQDEKELRELGYSQAEIDRLKPQQAADILKARVTAKAALE